MSFAITKRVHRLETGDEVRIKDEHGTLIGTVAGVMNSAAHTMITFDNGSTFRFRRNEHAEILNGVR